MVTAHSNNCLTQEDDSFTDGWQDRIEGLIYELRIERKGNPSHTKGKVTKSLFHGRAAGQNTSDSLRRSKILTEWPDDER